MKRPRTLRASLPGLGRILRFFVPRLRGSRRLLAASSAAMLAEVVLGTLEPWPLKFIFDAVLGAPRPGRAPAFRALESMDPSTLIAATAAAIVAIASARALADYAAALGFARAANRLLAGVRADLYRHLQGLSLSFHHKARGGDLLLRLMNDVNQLRDVAVTAFVPLLADVLVLAAMIGVMTWLHWDLAILALAMLPLSLFWAARLTGRIRQASRDQRQRESAMASTAAEAIGAIKVIQALSLEGRFAEGFLQRNDESRREDVRTARLTAALGRSVAVLLAGTTALVLWYGAGLVLRGELTPGELLVFMAYLRSAFRPARDLAKYTGRLVKASAAGERVIHLFEQTPEVRDLPGAGPAPMFRGAIEFRGVDFEYEPGRRVLAGVDLRIEPGQHVAVVGSSGIGKSTLASLILRLYDPTRGSIHVDGHDIREYRLASLRARIGVVLQDSLLFAGTIRENIALGADSPGPDRIEAAARLADAHAFITALPEGYETAVGERGVSLSGGQRQRIAIARAAIRDASILILDEPTTGLDEASERSVLDALARLALGRTTIWITHDLDLAARSDVILYLEGGRVVEQGRHEDLMAAGGRYARLQGSRPIGRGPAILDRHPPALAGVPAIE